MRVACGFRSSLLFYICDHKDDAEPSYIM
jgi:hypothetical protein